VIVGVVVVVVVVVGGGVGVERRGRVWLIRDFRAVISEVRGFKAIGIFLLPLWWWCYKAVVPFRRVWVGGVVDDG